MEFCCNSLIFRVDFKFLGILKKQFPGVPLLGLTATAGSHVVEDVKKILQIPDCLMIRASFNRRNLFYEVSFRLSLSLAVYRKLVDLFHIAECLLLLGSR